MAVRRTWFDPRLVLGLVLVAASVLGVAWLVSTADRTSPVLAADGMLLPGEVVTEADLVVAQVRLGAHDAGYLLPGSIPEEGLLVVRVVGAGELVPVTAVADAAELDRTAVVVTLHSPLPQSVAPGRPVELWASPLAEFGRFGEPTLLTGEVLLLRTVESDGMLAASTTQVELLVPRLSLDVVLAAVANGDALAVVAASGAAAPTAPADPAGGDSTDAPTEPAREPSGEATP